jgi:CRP-like cAMP-binding protein
VGDPVDGKITTLVATGLFDGWTARELRTLARSADLVEVSTGETLVCAGTWRTGCHILLSGAVLTTTAEGSSLTSAAGTFIGLAETLANVAARGDTVAMSPSTLLAFSPASFATALEAVQPLRRSALAELATSRVQPRRATARVAWATG